MDYVVDINIACYNQEKYIAQAIEGVIAQKTNFPFRIIIGDDCSTDGSAAIIKKYQQKFPDIIEAYFHPINLGFKGPETNGLFLLKKSNAKYITLLDGDDYWIDPYKLQKQVEFLETNPEFSICFHSVEVVYTDKSKPTEVSGRDQKQVSTFEDLALCNFINTVSCIFRNTLYNNLPNWLLKVPAGDWTIYLLTAQHGKIYFINEPMAVYRINPGSSWANQSTLVRLQKMISMLLIFEKKFDKKYTCFFKKSRSFYYMEMSSIYHSQAEKLKEMVFFYKACMTSDLYKMNYKDVLHKAKQLIRN